MQSHKFYNYNTHKQYNKLKKKLKKEKKKKENKICGRDKLMNWKGFFKIKLTSWMYVCMIVACRGKYYYTI